MSRQVVYPLYFISVLVFLEFGFFLFFFSISNKILLYFLSAFSFSLSQFIFMGFKFFVLDYAIRCQIFEDLMARKFNITYRTTSISWTPLASDYRSWFLDKMVTHCGLCTNEICYIVLLLRQMTIRYEHMPSSDQMCKNNFWCATLTETPS